MPAFPYLLKSMYQHRPHPSSPTEWTKDCSMHGLGWVKNLAALCDAKATFQPHAKLAMNGDHRLVGETHTRRQFHLVATDQMTPLVDVQAGDLHRYPVTPFSAIVTQPGHNP